MTYPYGCNEDYLDEDDDGIMYSTRDYSSDSGNEALPTNFFQQRSKKKLTRTCFKQDDDSEDDFEKEMSSELSMTMQRITAPFLPGISSSHSKNEDLTQNQYYDAVYFDSDESEPEDNIETPNVSKPKPKNRILSNDELLYDPNMDDEDQEWVDRKRRSYHLQSSRKLPKCESALKPKPLPQSDAVLNCPACFTTLCLDCQRHSIYKDQYRAMFVFNCVVDPSECLHFTKKEDKKKKFKKDERKNSSPVNIQKSLPSEINTMDNSNDTLSTSLLLDTNTTTASTDEKFTDLPEAKVNTTETVALSAKEPDLNDINLPCKNSSPHENSNDANSGTSACNDSVVKSSDIKDEDKFHPVKCTICGTKVAVYDKDEVYHFFNIITSY